MKFGKAHDCYIAECDPHYLELKLLGVDSELKKFQGTDTTNVLQSSSVDE